MLINWKPNVDTCMPLASPAHVNQALVMHYYKGFLLTFLDISGLASLEWGPIDVKVTQHAAYWSYGSNFFKLN